MKVQLPGLRFSLIPIALLTLSVAASAQIAGVSREPMSIADLIRARNSQLAAPVAPTDTGQAEYSLKMADAFAQVGRFDRASADYRQASTLFDNEGMTEEAAAAEMLAFRYETRLDLFCHRPTDIATVQPYNTHRRLEPVYGCYLGACIETEQALPTITDASGRKYRDCKAFDLAVGKQHAMFLDYMKYGAPFPTGFIATCRSAGAAAVLAVEPDDLDAVRDDTVLASFVEQIRTADIPVFVRFASEMNGDWTPWHKAPELYKVKFRLMADAVHAACPNAAMVWCPNDIPESKISAYYPGVDAVDWVGVNFYSTFYRNNDTTDPIPWRNPADKLDYVYKTYASLHPIMIGETGIAYQQTCDNVVRVDYAKSKLAELYEALPRRYPRVKAINYLSMNSILYSNKPQRRINNYSLMENDEMRKYYSTVIAPHYFLSSVDVANAAASTTEYVPMVGSCEVKGVVPISAYVKTYSDNPAVTMKLNGYIIDARTGYDPHVWQIDTTKLADGSYTLTVDVSVANKPVASRSVSLIVANNSQVSGAVP